MQIDIVVNSEYTSTLQVVYQTLSDTQKILSKKDFNLAYC